MAITALVSAYFGREWLKSRIINLRDESCTVIIICQDLSDEHKIALQEEVRIITTPHVPTIGEAWNLGIQEADTEYLTTANCDDLWKPGAVATLTQVLDERPEVGLVFSAVDRRTDAGDQLWERAGVTHGYVRDLSHLLSKRCFIGAMPIWRASLHDKCGLFREDYLVAADWDMWIRMARQTQFYYYAQSLGIYRKRSDSLEHRNTAKLNAEIKQIRSEAVA